MQHIYFILKFFAVLFSFLLISACGHHRHGESHEVTSAYTKLESKGKMKVKGELSFKREEPMGVRITGTIEGLKPNGIHGMHIHEFGDCTSVDAKSAGGHYNPGGHAHAGTETSVRHAGDMGNITADAKGVAKIDYFDNRLTLTGRHYPILGRSVIIHENADDLKTAETGNAGPRAACGVIVVK